MSTALGGHTLCRAGGPAIRPYVTKRAVTAETLINNLSARKLNGYKAVKLLLRILSSYLSVHMCMIDLLIIAPDEALK
jgi:hypothetical protein